MSSLASSTTTYLALAGSAFVLAAVAGIPLGVWSAASRRARPLIVGAASVARVVPSLSVLTFMIPVLGLGWPPALAALTLLAAAPIVIGTDLALAGVDAAVLEVADGLGMTRRERRLRVELPLALPGIFVGLRIAATEAVGGAVLASFVGAGGLGEAITSGLQANQPALLWSGVAIVVAIAVVAEGGLALLQRTLRA